MSFNQIKPTFGLESLGIKNAGTEYWNLTPAELVEETIRKGLGTLADTGALVVDTGKFTGRSPKDKFVVRDEQTENTVWWGDVNHPIEAEKFFGLKEKMTAFLEGKEIYIRDVYAGADPEYRLKVRVINTIPWANQFVDNMFIRPDRKELTDFVPDWTVIAIPQFEADPAVDGTRQGNFTMVNFAEKTILIGGSGYTGEIKKGIFTVMNYVLPMNGVLAMHCSANVGQEGDTAVFFGLSGTGKTTLSADPNRKLIGDDEHGWTDTGVFNFEGGCYAKCIDLTAEKEPEIWDAIKSGALLENIRYFPGTRTVNFEDTSVTENTRVSYPIDHIENIMVPSQGGIPKNIFFLTCDAFGVLPPISKLTPGQAMYQFISGYTAKVAGTEEGIVEPVPSFSSCFGEPFLPLHPTKYAEMLGEKMKASNTNVWLVNTGWTGGAYGEGSRIKLKFTRAMITAALEGKLDNVATETDPVFGLAYPTDVPGVPNEVLNPRNTWKDTAKYDLKAKELAGKFIDNFKKYSDFANEEIMAASPKMPIENR
ncbi:phosphoenolpyruvate carboxykinase (ATP) [Pontibacter sp. G13]|uniref:phosphoenolpyruvate carboxykinase (ATP) n=1 Tax=Pontibacter sp. G13 TaxID=3074898 RepID=UPI00288964FC|nr:phosphoenolpyruvate carboxykinase (ATP) [Pontibacter sp. G13]WNJ16236.1 phosphoenolpyruvate carboxykinase (ATP) [Pontibacter sp. G13]